MRARSSTLCRQQTRKVTAMNKTLDQIREELKANDDTQLRALALLDHDRLAKLADWIRSLDRKD